ncbi:MAG: Protein translocase subunit SecE [Alphaproteobacteria bacterium MarineAlpha9_Bin1]|nr:MAG: Protein translocase subunit SecE [Alphaproteobacteria bacterium MarineAlpha9_Bin1]
MFKSSPLKFIREVRQETSKVTWPTRKETVVTTVMVFIMVFLLSLFFLGVDQILSFMVKLVLGLSA